MANIATLVFVILGISLVAFLIWWFWPISGNQGPKRKRGESTRPIKTILLRHLNPAAHTELTNLVRDPNPPNMAVPTSFDSRQAWPGLITPSLDQGTCGSCWAFSTATGISDRIRIKSASSAATDQLKQTISYQPMGLGERYGVLNNLDPLALVNCDLCGSSQAALPNTVSFLASQGNCNTGCDGGVIAYAYDYVRQRGMPNMQCTGSNSPSTIGCNPTSSSNCACNESDSNGNPCDMYRISSYYNLVSDSDTDQQKQNKIQRDIMTNGPVTIGYSVYESFETFFENNPTGIYTSADQSSNDANLGGHAVDIIGWGTDPAKGDYWLVRNSWGTSWGDAGVFRIQYNWGDFIQEGAWGATI